jgi:hypothetical protein
MRLRDAYARDIPNMQQKFDYGARTDGQPDYAGFAHIGNTDDDTVWVIHYFVYDVSGFVTTIYSKEGAWSGRVALFA